MFATTKKGTTRLSAEKNEKIPAAVYFTQIDNINNSAKSVLTTNKDLLKSDFFFNA